MCLSLNMLVCREQALPEPQWLNCDVRTFDMSVLGKFGVIMTDPPWEIHQARASNETITFVCALCSMIGWRLNTLPAYTGLTTTCKPSILVDHVANRPEPPSQPLLPLRTCRMARWATVRCGSWTSGRCRTMASSLSGSPVRASHSSKCSVPLILLSLWQDSAFGSLGMRPVVHPHAATPVLQASNQASCVCDALHLCCCGA